MDLVDLVVTNPILAFVTMAILLIVIESFVIYLVGSKKEGFDANTYSGSPCQKNKTG
jgi:hypothetical protein